jgi:ribosomal-protein-serine acetyltransferase
MFEKKVSDDIKLVLADPIYSAPLYQLINTSREHLSKWLNWLDNVIQESDSEAYLTKSLHEFANRISLNCLLFHQEQLCGVISYNTLSKMNHSAIIGYWLGQAFQGKGIIRQSLSSILEIGFDSFNLNKITIRVASTNIRSLAIPKAFHFEHEGTSRAEEFINGQYQDLEVFSLLKENWESRSGRDD